MSSGTFPLGGMPEPIALDLQVSQTRAGPLITAYALVVAMASLLAVALTGRFRRRHVLLLGMMLVLATAGPAGMPGVGLAFVACAGALLWASTRKEQARAPDPVGADRRGHRPAGAPMHPNGLLTHAEAAGARRGRG